jgi:carbamoyl-phosphate synthase large subunit
LKDSLLVFGGSELQLSIIKKAKDLGYHTIVIDPDPTALAKKIADVFLKIDGTDFEKTLEVAKHYHVKGIVTSATDNPILMMCRIASEFNLLFPSYESCETLLDKGKFKYFLNKNNIPCAKGNVYTLNDKINTNQYIYPVILKPVIGSGSRGVIKCSNYNQLVEAIKETVRYSKDERFIVEEYIDGDEISVEAIVNNNKIDILQLTDKIVSSPPYNVELGHIQPSKYSNRIEEIQNILQAIIDVTGLNNCAIHPEFKVKNDKITIIELGPRLGGDYITSKLVPLSTGINMEEIIIKISTGQEFSYNKYKKASLIKYLNFQAGSTVQTELTKDELVKAFPNIVEFAHNLKCGTTVGPITNSLNRYGYFIIQSDNVEMIKKISENINSYISNKIFNQ